MSIGSCSSLSDFVKLSICDSHLFFSSFFEPPEPPFDLEPPPPPPPPLFNFGEPPPPIFFGKEGALLGVADTKF